MLRHIFLIVLFAISFAPIAVCASGDERSSNDETASSSALPGSSDDTSIGQLSNGVRFAIVSRQSDEPGIGFLMRVEGGFIAERRPGERGLAHLIEHIVFHSPTGGSPDDFDHLKRAALPLTFPAPNAGSTSWRETNFYLSTRSNSPGDVDTLLSLFREVAEDMTFREDAVNMSRDEVTREMADKAEGNTVYAKYIAAVAPGSPTDVIDAQNSEDVATATIPAIRALYERLYRPQNTMVVIVGDVDAKEMAALIEDRFGDWQPATPNYPAVPYPEFDRDRMQPISFSDRMQSRRGVLMTVVMETPAPPATIESQAQAELMDLLVSRAINVRLAAVHPDAPPGTIGMKVDNGALGQRQIMLWDNLAAHQWKPAVAFLRATTCKLKATGFSEAEWEAAKQSLVADLEGRAADMVKVRNVDVARDLSHAIADRRALISPDKMLYYAKSMLPEIDSRQGSRWWREQWDSGVEHLRIEGPELQAISDPVAEIRATANAPINGSSCSVL